MEESVSVGGRIGSVVLRNRWEVASGREDRELPDVIELVKGRGDAID